MARKSWIQDRFTGKMIPKEEYIPPVSHSPMIMPDLPDFKSPIDGSLVNGRAGLREHCLKHNVVPTADLAGLPEKRSHTEYTPTKQDREEVRRIIADQLYRR